MTTNKLMLNGDITELFILSSAFYRQDIQVGTAVITPDLSVHNPDLFNCHITMGYIYIYCCRSLVFDVPSWLSQELYGESNFNYTP